MIKIMKYGDVPSKNIFARGTASTDVSGTVREIIENVKENGDRALYNYCEKFDKAKLTCLEVTPDEIDEAFSAVEPEFIEILRSAAENIRTFHREQVSWCVPALCRKHTYLSQRAGTHQLYYQRRRFCDRSENHPD